MFDFSDNNSRGPALRHRLLPVLTAVILSLYVPAFAADKNAHSDLADASAAEGTRTAAVMPGIGREARIAPLPRPLSADDSTLYARIFKMQAAGQWAAADREMGKLKDDVLKGHILAQRYLQSGYRPKYQELRAWMADNADLPQSEAIYKLATAKGIKGFGAIKPPVKGALKGTGIDTSDEGANWEGASYNSDGGSPKVKALKTKFRQLLRQDNGSAALALLTGSEAANLSALDVDEMKTLMAADHFSSGRDAEAAVWAAQAGERSGVELPSAHWIAGLAQWRQGKPELARRHFEAVANSDSQSSWMVSAGAFWAARANLVSRRPEVVNHWLEIAATYPRTFYGMLARQTLGYETLFSWESPPFTEADADLLMRAPGTRRALALVQVGEGELAEEELRKSYPRATKALRQSMMVLAHVADMPGLAVRLGGMAPGLLNDAASYPLPDWNPRGGWQVDKALVYAFVRQESSFNPNARSGAGAAGLMQLMPATAAAIGGKTGRDNLLVPEANLALGQKYLNKLMAEEPVNGNLLLLAAAYNAGPGKLGQWLSTIKHNDDPLLFIEALPSRETRSFVERVMTNFWIYRSRLGQTSPSLDAVATGAWPLYEGLDPKPARKGGKS
ncbi:Lytic transglycosylase, catalytic [Magnetospirillum gryphiswaldense MSR-1 v2]|uniref:Lytic transglycosylase, catalytic n=1 Tax=Magnetospirillum gryphiswaldense (strain DSM 6361 / JCM 21280 / NBRC 15271 / MSR-1) TaxID=431944 RepID=V6F4C1_MAGGM|nr:Lytic transglycosylase, catalytic [Magnetospirillum gryphiswaldense MSR-1 v2]